MRFQGKVTVVTGASMGIGKAAAMAFAQEGANVAIVDIDQTHGEAATKEVQSNGGEALFVSADVSQAQEVDAMVEKVTDKWGRLDILVNNAGVYVQGDATETSLQDWERILAVNLTGAFLCTQYAIPAMLKNGSGVIVNVASEAGLVGIEGQVAYNVSKGGMIALTRSCAVDFAESGIRVNSVCPGTTFTPLVEEAVNRILYLASDEAGYATGSILSIDGGYTTQ
jgi:NAD(P)-dependent dehydrogenase (short-subunit alcohol dehydrogenase family)